ncbi:peptidoglycan-binding protein [Streptomyces gamaensis]|uniref:Peptidoglycan-binding protein n=1 Tax=Streptomyces gamaensis TaxID=1763542 RepID=A0ABW0Z4L5_9ACTN
MTDRPASREESQPLPAEEPPAHGETVVLDVRRLSSRRRGSRAARWRVPLSAVGVAAVAGAVFYLVGGEGTGARAGAAGRGAGAPDALPGQESESPGSTDGTDGTDGTASPSGGSPSSQGSPSASDGTHPHGSASESGSAPPGGSSPGSDQAARQRTPGSGAGDGRTSSGESSPGTGQSSQSSSRTSPPPGDGTLRPGDRGAQVSALQRRLFGQGFTYVEVTGVYDDRTRRGVAQLQSDRDLRGDPSGIYGPHTRAAFGLDG